MTNASLLNRSVRSALAVLLLALPTLPVSAASSRAMDALASNPALEYAPDAVLIRFAEGASNAQRADAYRRAGAVGRSAFGLVKRLEKIELAKGRTPEQAVAVLNNLPFVEYAELDRVVRAKTADTHYPLLYAIDNRGQTVAGSTGVVDADMDVLEAWGTTTGDPDLVIAVIDTGVDTAHPDLSANVWTNPGEVPGDGIDNDGNGYVDDIHGYDFAYNDATPNDVHGHGTHVAGTICATGNNNQGVVGVVQQCRIMALRFLDDQGSGFTSDAVAALDYAVAMGVRLSNNSWGGGGYTTSLYNALAAANAAGHLFVAAAGNDGVNNDITPHYPSSYDLPNVVAVAATDNRDGLAGFSNYGVNSVDIAAPGVNIVSTYPNGGYGYMSGTSMATPNVTGVVALILSQNPGLSVAALKDKLLSTVRPVASVATNTATGGVANAWNALYVASIPPASPGLLSATVESATAVSLAWSDQSDTETGFRIYRAEAGASFAAVATTGANATAWTDRNLTAETSYVYEVRAFNEAGESSGSNQVAVTTDALPTFMALTPDGETFSAAAVTGTFAALALDDGTVETLSEVESGGKPSNRHDYLEHTWHFTLPAASNYAVNARAWVGTLGDDGAFAFSVSRDGITFSPLFTVDSTDPSNLSGAILEGGLGGELWLKVTDTNQARGARVTDTLVVDQLLVVAETTQGTVPNAPSGLLATAAAPGLVGLDWLDNADDELGFEVERAENGGPFQPLGAVTADVLLFADESVGSQVLYSYRVRAWNAAGYSSWSEPVTVESAYVAAPALELTASGSKQKGNMIVDLAWTPADAVVDVYRDGIRVATNISTGSFRDASLGKGSGTFVYQVCDAGTASACSVPVAITF